MEIDKRVSDLKEVVLLSTADWDNPFWTNKQHVAVEFARRGYRVLYIDSLGLRRPSLSSRDVRRMLRRLMKAACPPRKVCDNIWVWSPIMLPFHSVPMVRRVNRWLLQAGLAVWTRVHGMRNAVLWTYNPLSTELIDLDGWSQVVYHCVDEIKAQPGMPVGALERAEEVLVKRADVVFVTSTTLETSRRALNPRTHYLPNVADFEHFSRAMDNSTRVPEDLVAIPGPHIGFIGAISGYKQDFELLCEVADRHPEWSLVLIGEVGEGDPWTDASTLARRPNVYLLGPRPYGDLPAYLKGMDVAILPSRINEYTAAMFPMKFFEYLAAGRPVVSVNLPSLQAYADTVFLSHSADGFMQGITDALSGRCAPLEQRTSLARQNTYSARMGRMLDVLAESNT